MNKKRMAAVAAMMVGAMTVGMEVPAVAQDFGSLLGSLLGAVLDEVTAEPENSETRVGVPQQNLAQWGIEAGNYSGITPLGNGRYAVVSDKGEADGFFVWKIKQDPGSGMVVSVENEGFFANTVDARSDRDCEGIIYFPKSDCVFISGEGDQRVLEYAMDGQRTGRELDIPEQFTSVVGNQGLEALGYGGKGLRARFWTTTETMLPIDGTAAGPNAPGTQNMLRLQSFKRNLRPDKQYAYKMDADRGGNYGNTYVFGTPEVCALPDGRVLVLEREANIPSMYVGAEVICKLYSVKPKRNKRVYAETVLRDLQESAFLEKELVATWATKLSVTNIAWANYEGMCLGEKLADGRQTMLFVSDSQGGYGKAIFHLQDFIKVIILDK